MQLVSTAFLSCPALASSGGDLLVLLCCRRLPRVHPLPGGQEGEAAACCACSATHPFRPALTFPAFPPEQVYVVGEVGIQEELDLKVGRLGRRGRAQRCQIPSAAAGRAAAREATRHRPTLPAAPPAVLPQGIKHIGGPADADKKVELTPGMFLEHDHDVSMPGVDERAVEGRGVQAPRSGCLVLCTCGGQCVQPGQDEAANPAAALLFVLC